MKVICALKPSFWNVNMAGMISFVHIFEQKSQIVKHDLVLGTRDKIGNLNFQFLQSTFEFQRKRRAQDRNSVSIVCILFPEHKSCIFVCAHLDLARLYFITN